MKTFISILCGLFLSFVTYNQVAGQTVWPGDMNNNGIVNEVDFLYWGSAYGSTGPVRGITPDTSYIGYPAPSDWFKFFNNGLNYYYADANGDGVVDDDDLIAINNNFGRKNATTIGSDDFPVVPGAKTPPLYITTQVSTFQNRKVVIFEVNLGDIETPVDSFYGFSFRLHYDTRFAQNGLTSIDLATENWVEKTEGDTDIFKKDDPEKGVAYVAITRKDHQTVKGSGTLLRGIIVVEDIVFTPERDTFTIDIDTARVVGPDLFSYKRPNYVQAKVAEIVSSVNNSTYQPSILRIYPNPAQEYLNIELFDQRISMRYIHVYNNLGQRIKNVTFSENPTSYKMNVHQLNPGMYTVVTQTSRGAYSRKILISR